MNRVYLDWAASAPPEQAAIQEAAEVSLQCFGNPSSPHAAGKEAAERLENARARLARLIDASAAEIVFTSGGTESNTSLLLSVLDRYRLGGVERRKARVVTTAVEHASIHDQALALEALGMTCTVVKPQPNGIVDPQAIADALDAETVLVSVMLVNNETGAIQRLAEISRLIREFSARRGRRIILHTDAVQALGKIPVSVAGLGVDAASFSAHKVGGPRGIGALYLRAGVAPGFLSIGGGQEVGAAPRNGECPRRLRLCQSCRAKSREADGQPRLCSRAGGPSCDGPERNQRPASFPESRTGQGLRGLFPVHRLRGFPPLTGEIVVRVSDAQGFCIATGSACSTKKKDHTRVLESMGMDHQTALSAIRISIGPSTIETEIHGFLAMLTEQVPPLLSISQGLGESHKARDERAGARG